MSTSKLKYTISDMQILAQQKGGVCLSDKYVGARQKLLWECDKMHQWEAVPDSIRRGSWCYKCSYILRGQNISKYTISDMQKLAQQKGGVCLSTVYLGPHTKLSWQCKNKHVWEAEPNSIRYGRWCATCSGKAAYTLERLRQAALNRGGKLISENISLHGEKLLWECSEGHQWSAQPNKIVHGRWCPYCVGRMKTIDDMRDLANSRGGKCLSSSYKDVRTKLLWECSEGHQWSAQPTDVISKKWCPYCSNSFGENVARGFFEFIFQDKFPKIRPIWLTYNGSKPLELDGYSRKRKIAFEHQGTQHLQKSSHFHRSEEEYTTQLAKDQYKVNATKERGISLFVIPEIPTILKIQDIEKFIIGKAEEFGISDYRTGCNPDDIVHSAFVRKNLANTHKIIHSKGGLSNLKSFPGWKTNFEVECKFGHKWQTNASRLKQGGWCRQCYNQKLSY